MNRHAFSLLLCAHVLSGCPRAPLPLDFGLHGRIEDPAVVFEVLLARQNEVRSVSGEAKANLETPQGSGGLTQFVLAEAPSSLRLESMDFFGRPVAVLSANETRARLFDVEKDTVYEGAPTAELVSRLLPIALSPEALVALLLGHPPLMNGAAPLSLDVDEQERVYVLTLESGADVQLVALDTKTLRPLWTRMPARGMESGWRASFENHDEKTGLARKVRLVSEDARTKVELTWRERELNAEIDRELFLLEIPEGAQVRAL